KEHEARDRGRPRGAEQLVGVGVDVSGVGRTLPVARDELRRTLVTVQSAQGGVGAAPGVLGVQATSPVYEGELVRVEVKIRARVDRGRVGGRGGEQLALRGDRDVLARRHGQRAGEQT